MSVTPGRNDPCPCGSGRKFKHCCLEAWSAEDAARRRIRNAEGHIVETLVDYIGATWGETFTYVAWEEFFVWDDVPEDLATTPEFDTMFLPWLTLGYAPDPHDDDVKADWPSEPVGLHWLRVNEDAAGVTELEREYIRAACASPTSAFVVEAVAPGRSLDVKDILTGKRFHVLEQGASKTLRRHELLFARVVTVMGTSVLFGTSPFSIPPGEHTRVIDFREARVRRRMMTREDLVDLDIEIRELYLQLVAEMLNPEPPRLANTDGDLIEWTTLTYETTARVEDVAARLAPLTRLPDVEASASPADPDDAFDDFTRDEHGVVTGAILRWAKAGNKKHRAWDNTILGTLTLEPGRIVAEVNSAKRAAKLKKGIARLLGADATLVDTKVIDVATALIERAEARAADTLAEALPQAMPPEMLEVQDEAVRRHIEGWIDEKIPALGRKTPRQAMRSAAGRERLAAMLAEFEDRAPRLSANAPRYVAELRTKLGLG